MVENIDSLLIEIKNKYDEKSFNQVDFELEKIAEEKNLSIEVVKERYHSLTKSITKYVDAVADSLKKD